MNDIKIRTIRKRVRQSMDQDKREKVREQKEDDKFNSITKSQKPENQNQQHNVRREGTGRQNNKY